MVIMIVEDNASMRKAIREVAAQKRDTVIECANGKEAVDLFQHARADWVLMDIQMPVMDGLAATRAIRDFDSDARVVIVSENDTEPFRRAASEAGARFFVSKSDLFQIESLLHSH